MMWRSKIFMFTLATNCPMDPVKSFTLLFVISEIVKFFGHKPINTVFSKELHATGLTHGHIMCEFDHLVCKTGIFRIGLVIVNNSRKKSGASNKLAIIKYVCKEGNFESSFDVPTYLELHVKKKTPSCAAKIVQGLKDGFNYKRLIQEFPEECLTLGSKLRNFIMDFRNSHREGKVIQEIVIPPWVDEHERDILYWINLAATGKLTKDIKHLYIWCHSKSVQKSTLLRVVKKVFNLTIFEYCQSDKGWQDEFDESMKILFCDALQTSSLPFKMVELLGDGGSYKFPRRNGGGVLWKGPMFITSNKHFYHLGYTTRAGQPYDMSVWDVRTLAIRIQRPLGKLAKYIAEFYGIDYSEFYDPSVSTLSSRKVKRAKFDPEAFGGF